MLPVPGPISSTTSVALRLDFSTMLFTTSGFFRKCWPRDLSAIGPVATAFGRFFLSLGMVARDQHALQAPRVRLGTQTPLLTGGLTRFSAAQMGGANDASASGWAAERLAACCARPVALLWGKPTETGWCAGGARACMVEAWAWSRVLCDRGHRHFAARSPFLAAAADVAEDGCRPADGACRWMGGIPSCSCRGTPVGPIGACDGCCHRLAALPRFCSWSS